MTTQAKDYPVKVGTFLFTMVEPHPGHEVAYNRWYEHDHFYSGCLVGPNVFAGDRFVATRRLKDLRSTAANDMTPDPLTGSYLAVYWWLKDTDDETNRWNVDNVKELHAAGPDVRRARPHPHAALLDALERPVRPGGLHHRPRPRPRLPRPGRGRRRRRRGPHPRRGRRLVPADLDPRRHGPAVGPRAGGERHGDPAGRRRPRRRRARRGRARTASSSSTSSTTTPPKGWEEGYARIGEQIEASGLAHHVWTGPWQQTNFGTDDFTGDLR